MHFQLLKLIIWPKNQDFLPQTVEFQPKKLNVITGASRTGKSAIIPIIDYCLGSKDCSIPIDTIRDHASWYGIVIVTSIEQILIARRVPVGNHSSNDFYFLRSAKIVAPVVILEPNENLEGVKHFLNGLSSVPYLNLHGGEENVPFQGRLGFRDLMAFVFQSQDIVANQNILFYKTHAHEHREKLRNWFPFIIGAETTAILQARIRIQEIEKLLSRLRREVEKIGSVSDTWVQNMQAHLRIAREYGLLNDNYIESTDTIYLLEIAGALLDNIPDHSNSSLENIDGSNTELRELERSEESLSLMIASLKKRLNDLKGLQAGLIDYGNSVMRRKDRLHISKWLIDMDSQAGECPSCGSNEHPSRSIEIEKISKVFKQLEEESKKVAEVPGAFPREEEKLKIELSKLLEAKILLQQRFDLIRAKDRKVQEEFQQRKNMFLFLGHLKAHYEIFQKLGDGGTFELQINTLQAEFDMLREIVDLDGVSKRMQAATDRISARMLTHLKTLDVEDKYKEVAPRFNILDLNILVLGSTNHWHYLSQVGSASNWVSFHVALMCALQEFFIGLTNSPVPSFVIFDQPSQVYFPKLKKRSENDTEDTDVKFPDDEDANAVKKIFRTIATSVANSKGMWQAIILDHADDNIYGTEDVHEVVVWRNGKKLIPSEWYEQETD
ncbi:hypothetical protein N180_01240 [Pedobacter antarcticus 4BY]|uniref:DUF3732 domain-containing protein n=2 Tax=Pedobacter antarcticus TaxID=34086 RepID=A0A081PC64_9SPHI|nr:DUF3732 domain-containing protein [Pedobacter antarcticus]KEQ28287.1 hypothetical protein N180_01240 [Pedobacter antarcticus 4BY]SFE47788.1 Protein of unknown function [Pedobacter antarcticus]